MDKIDLMIYILNDRNQIKNESINNILGKFQKYDQEDALKAWCLYFCINSDHPIILDIGTHPDFINNFIFTEHMKLEASTARDYGVYLPAQLLCTEKWRHNTNKPYFYALRHLKGAPSHVKIMDIAITEYALHPDSIAFAPTVSDKLSITIFKEGSPKRLPLTEYNIETIQWLITHINKGVHIIINDTINIKSGDLKAIADLINQGGILWRNCYESSEKLTINPFEINI